MIRTGVFVWLFMASLMGGTLYYVSQTVQDTKRELREVQHQVQKQTNNQKVLHAELTYLQRPSHVRKLARQQGLRPIATQQVMTYDALFQTGGR